MLCWTKVGGSLNTIPLAVGDSRHHPLFNAAGPNQAANDLDQGQAAEEGRM